MLRTSTNYDDTKVRHTGGTNGIGMKAVVIHSTEFTVDTLYFNGKTTTRYIQTARENMSVIEKP